MATLNVLLGFLPQPPSTTRRPRLARVMKYVVWPLLVLLVVLNQDYWQWDRAELVWGFLPYTLVFQVGVSLGAAAVWLLAVTFCWPQHLEDFEPVPEAAEDPPPGGDAA